MYLRIDKLQFDLPLPKERNPNAAATVQELFGGRFGEMSTLMNYTMQSFNFRGKKELKPYYDLISNIAAEELGHIELVAAAVNALLAGPDVKSREEPADPTQTPLDFSIHMRNAQNFIAGGPGAMVQDSRNIPWTGDNVFSSGNLVLDLLHNFFLESGARQQKLRVYESVSDPVAKALTGYLLVRGGVHQVAYAKALETLTGVEMTKMLPVPHIPTEKIPESKRLMDQGIHRDAPRMPRFSNRGGIGAPPGILMVYDNKKPDWRRHHYFIRQVVPLAEKSTVARPTSPHHDHLDVVCSPKTGRSGLETQARPQP